MVPSREIRISLFDSHRSVSVYVKPKNGGLAPNLFSFVMSSLLSRVSSLSRLSRPAVNGSKSVAAGPKKLAQSRGFASSLLQRSVVIQTRSFYLTARTRSKRGDSKEEPDLHKLTDDEYVHQQLPPELYAQLFCKS